MLRITAIALSLSLSSAIASDPADFARTHYSDVYGVAMAGIECLVSAKAQGKDAAGLEPCVDFVTGYARLESTGVSSGYLEIVENTEQIDPDDALQYEFHFFFTKAYETFGELHEIWEL